MKSTIILCTFPAMFTLLAANVVDCGKKPLAKEVEKAKPGESIEFTGTCAGPIVIRTEGVGLRGVGPAAIDGGGQDAIVVIGIGGVELSGFEVRNGLNGILGQNGAHLTIADVTVTGSSSNGINLQTSSSAIIRDSIVKNSGLHGLALETGSSATITGSFSATNNRVFGLNVNGSSLTLAKAAVTSSANALGMQVATSANAFLNDSMTVLDLTNNLATGLTVVSGAHMVSFGGRINATGNGAFGVSVNSKGGLDLDAGSILTASNNRAGGVVLQQQSVMTVFNNPQFSGAPGFSTISATGNTGTGVGVLTGSTLTLVNQARVESTGNGAFGLLADNGAGVVIRNSTLTGNTVRDLQLTFGARAELQVNNTLGTSGCDATVLIRGAGLTCPQ